MISRKPGQKQGRFRKIAKRVGAGVLAVGVAAGITVGVLKMNAAELAGRKAFFEGRTKAVAGWVDASKKLGISSKELNSLHSLNPATLAAVESKARELGMKENGIARVLETIARHGGKELDEVLRDFENRARFSKTPQEKERIVRVRRILVWFDRLPPEAKREIAELASKYEIPTID